MSGAAPSQPRVVVVLGFHRSGTSMVTRMLNLLGVELGDASQLLEPEERDNARGYWEPRWMIELNEELLAQLGAGPFRSFAPEPGWELAPKLDPLRERARKHLESHFASTRTWGWKDPRTSLTLPFWRTVVEQPMAFVICVRSPADAVASALKRGLVDIHRWEYAERWLDYTAASLDNTEADERLLVFYEDALHDPAGETRRLAAFIGTEEPSPERLEETVASVDPDLRHHITSPLDVAVDPGLPVETRALYLLLRAHRELERDGADGRLRAAIERIATELRVLHDGAVAEHGLRAAAEQRLGTLSEERDAEAARQAEQTEQLEQRLQTREQELAQLADQLASVRADGERRADELERDAAQLRATLAEHEAVRAEREAVLAERDAALATLYASRSWRLTSPLRAFAARRRTR
jgi:hypothetical protein